MRQFLICGGVHGERRNLDWMRTLVETKQPDGVLFIGGFRRPSILGIREILLQLSV
jgi:hypothetical protein